MSASTLPHSLRPGTDQMSKEVITNPAVTNIITLHLTGTEGDYIIGNNEWRNVCHRTSSKTRKPFARVSACYSFPCNFWAKECLIVSKESVEVYETTTPLDPFVALGIFCINSATSLIESNCNGDPTMVQLYNLALRYYQHITGNQQHLTDVLTDTLNTQEKEYEHLLKLVNNQASPEIIRQAIRTAQERNQEFKRQYNELNDTDPSSAEVSEIEDNAFAKENYYGRSMEGSC
ncbi:hypothetical protein BDC45DRAFT_554089 [Circinella umbellata]|nr:hypothetical protein BDC45DRAFT_554089 [Circinella umbellata]